MPSKASKQESLDVQMESSSCVEAHIATAPAPVPAPTPAPTPSQPTPAEDVEMSDVNAPSSESSTSNGSQREINQLSVGKADLVKGVSLSEVNKYTIGELKEFLSLNFPEVDEQEVKGKKKGALIDFVLAKLNS